MRLRGRVGLVTALAASACSVLAPSAADAGLIAALSTDRAGAVGGDLDVFLLDPASTSVNLPPAGVNTSGVELGVSLTADGSRLGFTSAGQTFLVDRSNGQRASIPPEGSTAGPTVVARRTGAVSPDGTEFVTGSQRNDGVSSVFVFDVTDLAAVSQGARVRSDLLENEDDAVALDPVVADNGRLAWIENPPIVPIPQRADQGTIGFATGSTLGRPILRPANSTLLASEPTIKPLPTKAVSGEDTAITFTRQPGRLDPRVDLGVVVMDGDPGYELLSLPGVSLAGEEMLPAWSGDGRYLAFVAVSAERRTPSGLTLRDGTLKVYDTLTQALVNPAGRFLGTKHRIDSLALARTPPLIVGFAIPNTTISPVQGAATLAANLSGPTNLGILVQRITGTRRLFGRRVPRLRNVGRVPLGGHRRGRSQIPWSLRVNGRRLAPGRYQITLRALRGSRVTDLSKPVTVRVR